MKPLETIKGLIWVIKEAPLAFIEDARRSRKIIHWLKFPLFMTAVAIVVILGAVQILCKSITEIILDFLERDIEKW